MRLFFVAGVILWTLLSAAVAVPCSQSSQVLIGKDMALQIVDSAVVVRPVDSQGRVVTDSVRVSLSLDVVMERLRTTNFQDTEPTCHWAHQIAPWTGVGVTINSSLVDSEPYGEVVNYYDLHRFNCEATFERIQHNGVNVSQIRLAYSSSSETLQLEALFEVPDGSTLKEAFSQTNYTTNHEVYRTFYEKDVLKISWTGANYTWSNPDPTFLIVWNNLTVTVPPGNVSFSDDKTSVIDWVAKDNKTSFSWSVEKDFVLDGYPYGYLDNRTNNGSYVFEQEISLSIMQGVAACVDNLHWKTFSVDPTLALLFSADPSIPAAPGKKVPVVAIVVPVVLVCAVIIVIILLVVFVTPVRHFFMPYRKREEQRIQTEMSDRQPTWNKAAKPSI